MYRLLFQNRASSEEPVIVDLSSFAIGRDATCQLRLYEDGVVDRHALIERRADGYYIRDLDSPTGVYVNDQLVAQRRLVSGDELEIGAARLRFEIVHGVPSGQRRRSFDLLQLMAFTIVVVVIGGQIVLLHSIFSGTRPKKMKVEMGRGWRGQQAMIEPPAPATPAGSGPRLPLSEGLASPAAQPTVLNRMIRIVRVDRSESGGGIALMIQAKTQVGERELDVAAVALCVQFAASGEGEQNVVWRDPIWLHIPSWENFTSKVFTVRFPGAPREMMGFVVRTYYHNQLQDIAAAPLSLQPSAPNPIPGGAS